MRTKHSALVELETMEKTLDNTKKYVSKHLAHLAFHWIVKFYEQK